MLQWLRLAADVWEQGAIKTKRLSSPSAWVDAICWLAYQAYPVPQAKCEGLLAAIARCRIWLLETLGIGRGFAR